MLLQCPQTAAAPSATTVYGLVAGRFGTSPLARYRLPAELRDDVIITEGAGHADCAASLPILAELAYRLAPWVQVHIVPRVLSRRPAGDDFARTSARFEVGDEGFTACGGLACSRSNLVFIREAGPSTLITVLAHELMHMLWHGNFLNAAAMGVIREAVAARPVMPGNYHSCESEAVAELFEGYAHSRFYGMPAPDAGIGLTAHGILEEIWSGSLARWLIARDLVPGAAALRDRLDIPLHVETLPEPLPPMPVCERIGQSTWSLVARAMDEAGRLLFERLLGFPEAM